MTTISPSVGVISLGCSKNRVDTENLLGMLKKRGFEITNNPADADVIIVNTCGFITAAKEESIDTILEMARYRTSTDFKCSCLAVTGCLSQRYFSELSDELPEADILWGVHDYENFADSLSRRFGLNSSIASCNNPQRILTTPPYSAYLRISDGCFNRCSYCAIPNIRGSLKSVPETELLDEAHRLADSGVTELNIIAQDTSAYGVDIYHELRLAKLLRGLSKTPGLRIIRLLYAYPDTITDELTDVILESDNIANYMDIPIQHINDRVLKSMNRHMDGNGIRKILSRLREKDQGFIIRTSLIVGFPGETDSEFNELLEFLREYPIDRVGAFMYSPEDGTPAAQFPDQIDEAIKEERFNRLMTLQSEISLQRNKNRIGQITDLLVEGVDKTTVWGRSYAEAPEVDGNILIRLPNSDAAIQHHVLKPGDYVRVRLISASKYDMEGELI